MIAGSLWYILILEMSSFPETQEHSHTGSLILTGMSQAFS